MTAPQHLQFLGTMTGLTGWKPSSASYSIEDGWAAGFYLRFAPRFTLELLMLVEQHM